MPVTPWITVSRVLEIIASEIHKPVAVIQADTRWIEVATRALNAGMRDVRNPLVLKGYSDAQLEVWDDRVSYLEDQVTFWALTYGAGLGAFGDRDVIKFDHRKEMKDGDFTIMVGNALVYPGAALTEVGGSVLGGDLMGGVMPRGINGEVSGPSTFRTQKDRRDFWGFGPDQYSDDIG